MGTRKLLKEWASSLDHSYLSTKTSNRPQGFSLVIWRRSPEKTFKFNFIKQQFSRFTSYFHYKRPSRWQRARNRDKLKQTCMQLQQTAAAGRRVYLSWWKTPWSICLPWWAFEELYPEARWSVQCDLQGRRENQQTSNRRKAAAQKTTISASCHVEAFYVSIIQHFRFLNELLLFSTFNIWCFSDTNLHLWSSLLRNGVQTNSLQLPAQKPDKN